MTSRSPRSTRRQDECGFPDATAATVYAGLDLHRVLVAREKNDEAMTDIRPIAADDHDAWRELFRDVRRVLRDAFHRRGARRGVGVAARSRARGVGPGRGRRGRAGRVSRTSGACTTRSPRGPPGSSTTCTSRPTTAGQGVARALIERGYADATAAGGGTFRWITAADNETAQPLYDRIATRAGWVVYEKELG